MAARPKPSQRLLNPEDGTEVFGVVPKLRLGHLQTEEAPIYLQWGRHKGPHHGHGASHIWAEHRNDMGKLGLMTSDEVPAYVKRVIKSGTSLYFEAERMRGNQRTSAVRSSAGTVILEYVEQIVQGEVQPYWRIITAFPRAQGIGTAVGRIK
jgi:hypothetical protein